jgi:PAS domain S-box-containing protein
VEDDTGSQHGKPELYRALVEASRDVYTLVDRAGTILYQSPSITEVLGWKVEDVEGTCVLDYAHEGDLDAITKEFGSVLKHPGQPRRTMLRMRHKDGSWQSLDSVLRNELENPALQGIVIETRDVVVGPELHRGLQNTQHLFRTIVSHPSIMIWAVDIDGLITVSEGEALKLLGIEPGALVGLNVFDVYADAPHVLAYIRRALAGETLDYTVDVPGPSGDLTVDNRLRPQYSDQGKIVGVTAITFEVSARVLLENKLRRAETMEAIGMLVGGVAHDFNNLLTAIIGFATVAKRANEDKRGEYLGHVIESADRGANLVRQLLSFARKDEVRLESVDVPNFLRLATPLFRQILGDKVSLDITIDDSSPCQIRIDRIKLEQVLLNLVTNARDAMPSGGNLRVDLSSANHETGERWVHVEVADSGVGMDADTLRCVFDPFFSTKQQGSGLGLATSHSIVSRGGGTLTATSEVDKGTRFMLQFPCHEAIEAAPIEEVDPAPSPVAAVVLLIDENVAVLRSTALSLEASGYEVTVAESGQEGYDIYLSDKERFDIVVTDMTMPGMKGDELAGLLRKIDDDIPILCVSGFHAESSLLAELQGVSLLSKPYHGDELVETIARMLAKS